MRLFIGLKAGRILEQEAVKWESRIKLPVRWIAPQNLHFTLIPPWEEAFSDSAEEILEKVSTLRPLTVQLQTISFGPNPRTPRLIWAEGPTSGALLELKTELEYLFGCHSENQKFKLHLTLARFLESEFRRFPVKHLNEKIDWQEPAHSLCLFESQLSPRGANYRVIKQISIPPDTP